MPLRSHKDVLLRILLILIVWSSGNLLAHASSVTAVLDLLRQKSNIPQYAKTRNPKDYFGPPCVEGLQRVEHPTQSDKAPSIREIALEPMMRSLTEFGDGRGSGRDDETQLMPPPPANLGGPCGACSDLSTRLGRLMNIKHIPLDTTILGERSSSHAFGMVLFETFKDGKWVISKERVVLVDNSFSQFVPHDVRKIIEAAAAPSRGKPAKLSPELAQKFKALLDTDITVFDFGLFTNVKKKYGDSAFSEGNKLFAHLIETGHGQVLFELLTKGYSVVDGEFWKDFREAVTGVRDRNGNPLADLIEAKNKDPNALKPDGNYSFTDADTAAMFKALRDKYPNWALTNFRP